MRKIDSALYKKLAADPQRSVAVIVRTDGDPTPYLSLLAELGLQVTHQFRLVPGVSATGPAAAAMQLLEKRWVLKIEEDLPVKTMP